MLGVILVLWGDQLGVCWNVAADQNDQTDMANLGYPAPLPQKTRKYMFVYRSWLR
jgi:hypothetical protein